MNTLNATGHNETQGAGMTMNTKRYAKEGVPIFYSDEVPGGFTEGMSVYKGVLVLWDKDFDARVLEFVDQVPDALRARLLTVQEHKAYLFLLWHGEVPEQYAEAQPDEPMKLVELEDDTWYVAESRTVK